MVLPIAHGVTKYDHVSSLLSRILPTRIQDQEFEKIYDDLDLENNVLFPYC